MCLNTVTTGNTIILNFSPEKVFHNRKVRSGRSWSLRSQLQWWGPSFLLTFFTLSLLGFLSLSPGRSTSSNTAFLQTNAAPGESYEVWNQNWGGFLYVRLWEYHHQGRNKNYSPNSNLCVVLYNYRIRQQPPTFEIFHLKEFPLGFRLRRLDFPWVSLGPLAVSDSAWNCFIVSVLEVCRDSAHHGPCQGVLTAPDGLVVLVL